MAPPKVKTVKQAVQLKQEEQSLPQRLHQWIEDHRNAAGGVIAGLFIIFLMILGVQSYLSSQESRAQERYAQVMLQWPKDFSTADDQTMEKLIPDLQKFIGEHEGKDAAWLARLDLARVLFQLRRWEEALGQNQKVLDGASESMLKNMARYQAAVTLQAMGRSDEAIAQWTALKGGMSLVSERELNWYLASLYGSKQDYPKAIECLELSIKASGDYPANQLLEDQLASLKAAAAKGS